MEVNGGYSGDDLEHQKIASVMEMEVNEMEGRGDIKETTIKAKEV